MMAGMADVDGWEEEQKEPARHTILKTATISTFLPSWGLFPLKAFRHFHKPRAWLLRKSAHAFARNNKPILSTAAATTIAGKQLRVRPQA